MLKNLVKIANRLDYLGLQKEADIIDSFLLKEATRVVGGESWLQNFVDIMEKRYNYQFDGDILIAEDGETIPTPETPEEGRDILLKLGMDDSEISKVLYSSDDVNLGDLDVEESYSTPYGDFSLKVWEEPPLNKEDIISGFQKWFMESRGLVSLDVTYLEWNNNKTDFPHYNVESEGMTEEGRPYHINTQIGVSETEGYGYPVEGSDGKTYYLYAED